MADFLTRLAARTLGTALVAQPVIPAMFTPASKLEGIDSTAEFAREVAEGPGEERDASGSTRSDTLPGLDRSNHLSASFHPEAIPPGTATLAMREEQVGDRLDHAPAAAAPSPVTVADPSWLSGSQIQRVKPPLEPALTMLVDGPAASEPGRAHQNAVVHKPLEPQVNTRIIARPAPELTSAFPAQAGRQHETERRSDMRGWEQQAPVIRVTIGRVEVRAEFPARPSSVVDTRRQQPSAALSLEEYSRQRREGKR